MQGPQGPASADGKNGIDGRDGLRGEIGLKGDSAKLPKWFPWVMGAICVVTVVAVIVAALK